MTLENGSANLSLGWEPIFEHEGETLAEMALEKKVRAEPDRCSLVNSINLP